MKTLAFVRRNTCFSDRVLVLETLDKSDEGEIPLLDLPRLIKPPYVLSKALSSQHAKCQVVKGTAGYIQDTLSAFVQRTVCVEI